MGAERFNSFKNAFDVFYLSYEMGMRKPDAEIFDFVLQENQLTAEETFFVDDVKENTDSAANIGIKVWNLQVGQEAPEVTIHWPCRRSRASNCPEF